MKIKAGTMLVLDTGEYSDYTFHGPFKVAKDFDEAEVITAYRAQWTAPNEWTDEPDPKGFMGWLSSQGYIEHIDHISWHIGSYGKLEAKPHEEPADLPSPKS